ncbi:glycosyltransferase family 2 protein [Profundibacterium mesophilum]|uniref:Glycoprotein 3-alpha-L-fucosyltransferase n=1 Tax=Profundibacterium mesophilum KAUST100406-0324 TaxID=1037889 RepID=A0A921NWG7_9RHOB|nr:glycosyltransferase [Profundibacterium mesophilum]KAF0676938.1 glycoprotein 3-alpha-L-fucosyltransferase [Profundibacterium mesophilum KAUST100406-0324]
MAQPSLPSTPPRPAGKGTAPGPAEAAQRVIVAIPSVGRAPILRRTVAALAEQTRRPDAVWIAVPDPEDAVGLDPAACPFDLAIMQSPRGLTAQRNTMIDAAAPGDLLLMLDDDFLLAPDFLQVMENIFDARPETVMLTGHVLADGIIGPGFEHDEGREKLRSGLAAAPAGHALTAVHTGYGCNMAFRAGVALSHDIRFDEALPLYGWLEDVDFSARLAPHGEILRAEALRGVHLGTKTGRTPGVYLGYSQMVNPVYMVRKGTLRTRLAAVMMARNMASNTLRGAANRGWADYRGRLRGNLLAWADILRGRDRPDRILELKR